MRSIELLEILQEYRKGNTAIFDTLFTTKINKNKIGSYQSSTIKFNDRGLENDVNCWYDHYVLPLKFSKDDICPKFHKQVYNGSIEDLKQDLILTLFNIFNDKNFNPSKNYEVYAEVKNRMMRLLGASIETSAYAETDIRVNKNNEEYSLLDYVRDNTNLDENYYYNGVMLEIADIVHNFDVKLLLKKDAYVQRNVIDIIYKYYDYRYNEQSDELELPKQSEMLENYKTDFGAEITQSQYSRALSDIFKAICNCTTTLKGVDIKRDYFIDKETNIYDIQKIQFGQ